LGAWVELGPTSPGNLRLFYAATAYELEEAATLARKMLADRSRTPIFAFNVLSKQGSIDDVKLIEPWIWDANSQKPRQYGNSGIWTSTGDKALATCLKLSGLELKDFGFKKPENATGDVYGFENDKQRSEARRKWKEFRKNSAE
jgi:hypothetical protein